MAKSVVALVRCESYDAEKVYEAVKTGVSLQGGPDIFVQKDEQILLKPNLLGKAAPEKAVTTHPAVFGAVARLFREAGCDHLSYGDSPGNPATTPQRAAFTSGIQAEADKWGVTPADFSSGTNVRYDEGRICRSFVLCSGVLAADAIISIAKMKTHALERITGAMKNVYGCIYYVNKAAGHARFPDTFAFADMIADLQNRVKPRLTILDGITAMEGNGPTSGTPVSMNVLLFSADPVALDSVFAALVNVPAKDVPTCVSGERAGAGVMDEENIIVRTPGGDLSVRETARLYGKPDFNVFRGKMKRGFIVKLVPLLPFLQERPQVDACKCVGCGICETACPVPGKAVHSGRGQKARYDYRKCIRCFCCQEMCPEKAITVYRSPLNRLLR